MMIKGRSFATRRMVLGEPRCRLGGRRHARACSGRKSELDRRQCGLPARFHWHRFGFLRQAPRRAQQGPDRGVQSSWRRARWRARACRGRAAGRGTACPPGQGVVAGWYRPAEVWTHPYLFKDVAHKDRVWDTMRAEYQEDIAKAAKLRPLGAIPACRACSPATAW